jgi:hypothetical protein
MVVVKPIRATQTNRMEGENTQKGLIIYESGYYVGQLAESCPEGKGSFYFTAQKMKNIVVKGMWHEGRID